MIQRKKKIRQANGAGRGIRTMGILAAMRALNNAIKKKEENDKRIWTARTAGRRE